MDTFVIGNVSNNQVHRALKDSVALTVPELARKIGAARPTVSEVVVAMQDRGYAHPGFPRKCEVTGENIATWMLCTPREYTPKAD